MKEVYIITFHWATNYGAVLQCYALESFLQERKFEVHVIDYVPQKLYINLWRSLRARTLKQLHRQLMEYRKEQKLAAFRRKNLALTQHYATHQELLAADWQDAIYICGSDQIWNPFFTLRGENNHITTPYFLDFVKIGTKISYAASFGTTTLCSEMETLIYPLLKKFERITVREKTAVEMLQKINISASVVCDPVFLVERERYREIMCGSLKKNWGIFKYILHGSSELTQKILDSIDALMDCRGSVNVNKFSLEEWLSALCNAKLVVSNSFHAIAFSIIFHVPFVAILIPGSGMNDRIITLLDTFGLSERMISNYDENAIKPLLFDELNWEDTDKIIGKLRNATENIFKHIGDAHA